MHQLTLENWPIVRLIDYARNPRKNDHAVEQMAGAIREFGFRIPIIAKSTGDVVDGPRLSQNLLTFSGLVRRRGFSGFGKNVPVP